MVYRINTTENSLLSFIQDRYENDTYQLSNFKDVTDFPIQIDTDTNHDIDQHAQTCTEWEAHILETHNSCNGSNQNRGTCVEYAGCDSE